MSESKKITNLAEVKRDSRLWDPKQCLLEVLRDIESGVINPDRVIVLAWGKDEKGEYSMSSYCANFTTLEYMARLQTAAHKALHDFQEGK